MTNVLFVCVQNAGRSQLAQALYERLGGNARSAGTKPAERVHPEVVDALAELGIDLDGRVPHELSREYVDWELEDPAGKGPDEVRAIRDEIERRVASLPR